MDLEKAIFYQFSYNYSADDQKNVKLIKTKKKTYKLSLNSIALTFLYHSSIFAEISDSQILFWKQPHTWMAAAFSFLSYTFLCSFPYSFSLRINILG